MDIDFDELDRAVNSLMEKRAQKQAQDAQNAQDAATAASSSAPVRPDSSVITQPAPITATPAAQVISRDPVVQNSTISALPVSESKQEAQTDSVFRPSLIDTSVVSGKKDAVEIKSEPVVLPSASESEPPADPDIKPQFKVAPVESYSGVAAESEQPEPMIEPVPELQPKLPVEDKAGFPNEGEANGFPHDPAQVANPEPVNQEIVEEASVSINDDEPTNVRSTSSDESIENGEKIETEVVEPSPMIARRPSGRFMDVIRPNGSTTKPSSMPSRSGVTLQPTGSYLPGSSASGQESVNGASDESEMVNGELANAADQAEATPSEPSFHQRLVIQPDPSHLSELNPENVSLSPKDVPDYESITSEAEASTDSSFVEEGLIADKALNNLETDVDESAPAEELEESEQATGQLGDAKSTEIVAPKTLEATIDEIESDEQGVLMPDDTTVESDKKPAISQPEEFGDELMSIEAMDAGAETPDQVDTVKSDPADSVMSAALGSGEGRSIFDTATDQPTAGHSAREKKSSIGTVLLIILFALLGIGGGAAAYFLLLQ